MRASAALRQRSARSVSPRRRARSAPRSAATQHRTADAVKCWGSPADLPDALVGVATVGEGVLDQSGQSLPDRADDLGGPLLQVLVDAVEQHPPHVVLMLVPGAVAHPDRSGPVVAGQMVEGPLGEVALAADAVHDLKLERVDRLPWLTLSSTKAKYSRASQSKPSR